MKKFSFKSIAFLMSLIMVFSIFAPVVASAAEYAEDHAEKGPLNYVSIGDSMTNGFGLDGYYVSDEQLNNMDADRAAQIVGNTVGEGGYQVYGFLQEAPKAYPNLFKEYLAGEKKCEVDLTQLAISSLRAEDIWYLLSFDSTTGEAAWDGDGYTMLRHINDLTSSKKENTAFTGYNVPELAEIFQKTVEDADVISLAVGPNNFSTFFTVAFLDDLLQGGVSNPKYAGDQFDTVNYKYFTDPQWDYIKEHLDAATEKDLEELFEDLEILSEGVFADLEGVFPEDATFAGKPVSEVMKYFAERLVYTTASFTIGYRGIINEIKRLNPDVEIINVNMTNWLEGVVFNFGGFELPVGDLLQNVYDFANDFMALSCAFYENQEDCELDFYYADVTDKEYAMIIEDIYSGKTVTDATRTCIIEGMGDMDVGSMLGIDSNLIVGENGYLSEYKDGLTMRDYLIETLNEGVYTVGDKTYTYLQCIEDFGAVVEALRFADSDVELSNLTLGEFALAFESAEAYLVSQGKTFDPDKAIAVYQWEKENNFKNGFDIYDKYVSVCVGDLYKAEMYVTFEKAMAKCGRDKYFTASNVATLFYGVGGLMAGMDTPMDPSDDGIITKIVVDHVVNGEIGTIGYVFYADALSDKFYDNEYDDGLLRELFFAYGTLLVGWGLACHPSESGHQDVCDAMVEAYENDYSATDKAVEVLDKYAGIAYKLAIAMFTTEINDAKAYIDEALVALNDAIAAVEALEDNDQKALIIEELYNAIETLEAAKAALNDLKGESYDEAWAAVLTLEGTLAAHVKTLKALGLSVGGEIDTYLVKAYDAVAFYASVVDAIIDEAYAQVQSVKDQIVAVNDAYLAFVEYAGAVADKLSPAIGEAVRAYLVNTPADAFAIIYAYGEEAVVKFIVDAANASGEILDVAVGFAVLLEEYGDDILYIIKNTAEYDALVAELENLADQIKATAADLEQIYADLNNDAILREKIAKLEAELEAIELKLLANPLSSDLEAAKAEIKAEIAALTKELVFDYAEAGVAAAEAAKAELVALYAELDGVYAAIYDLYMATAEDLDPLVASMFKDSIAALFECFGLAEDAGVDYVAWLLEHFKPMAGELLASVLGNTLDLFDVVVPGIKGEIMDFIENIEKEIEEIKAEIEELYEALMELNSELKRLYDKLAELYAKLETAVGDAKEAILAEIEKVKAAIDEIIKAAKQLEAYIKELEEFVAENGGYIEALKAALEEIDFVKNAFVKELLEAIKDSLNVDYDRDEESYYVAIGGSTINAENSYAALLAEKLGVPASVLGVDLRVSDLLALLDAEFENDEYGRNLFDEETAALLAAYYAAEIEKADLITLDFGNADFTTFASNQLLGYLVETNKAELTPFAALMGLDLGAFKAYALDWTRFEDVDKYVDVEEILADVEKALIGQGLPAEYVYTTTLSELTGIDWTPIFPDDSVQLTIYPADMVMYAVECYLYSAVNYAYNLAATIEAVHAINPDAEVVVLGTFNALEGLVIDLDGEVLNVSDFADKAVAGINAYTLATVVSMDKTTYVDIPAVETIIEADGEVTLDEFISIEALGFNPDALTPSEAGSAYIAEQILNALRLTCAHAYDNACDAVCNICAEEREVADHVYDNACDADCNVCGAEREVADHVYANACDADCDVCGATRTPAAHVYANACDADCNVCGATRTPAAHVYANACDADCNVCGATRTPAAHVYANACDADCDVCGATRTPAAHEYANDCDADCNVCGETRTPAEHQYDNSCDADCNVCGAERAVDGHMFGEWVVVEEATADKEGTKKHTCSECGFEETETIAKLEVTTTTEAGGDDDEKPANVAVIVVIVVVGVAGVGTGVFFILKKFSIL